MISTVFIVYDILPGDFANLLLSFATGAPRALPSAAPRRAVHATTRGFYYAKSLLEDLGTPGVPRLPVPDVY